MTKQVIIQHNAGNVYLGPNPEYEVDSAINELLNQLASKPFIFQRTQRRPPAATVVKIQHNQISSKNQLIKQYLDHSQTIEAAYADIDSMIPFGKQIILQNLNDLYCAALDDLKIEYLCNEVDIVAVREHSVYILDYIIQKLKNTVFESKNISVVKEQIELGVNVVVAHAFIECVIFENPDNDT